MLTVDGGRSWRNVTPAGGAAKGFRDVEATDRYHAVVLAGGASAQIYRTADGGATWHVVFEDASPGAYYDCMAFFDRRRGLAVSDPVDGRIRLAGTEDGGRSWRVLRNVKMPPAVDGETLIASGTCLQAAGTDAWFGTSTPAGVNNRVFTTKDGGRSWSFATTPLPGGDDTGILSLSFRDPRHGIAIGSDPRQPSDPLNTAAALTSDGGRTWTLAGATSGRRVSVSWLPGQSRTLIAVGRGSDISTDGGQTWRPFDDTTLPGIDCLRGAGCWAVGAGGLAAKLSYGHSR
ncbi:WD40/YVTN/BNR-like repeat-containing protein [Paractinoplanes durhamensis]|uniref:WD40/YVTN/BNR-like repeat-containing protein n=1 Tax=Paractinoplanes durhamensis TaxID=113563 RepID=UPI00363D6785